MSAALHVLEAYVDAHPDDAARRMEGRAPADLAGVLEVLDTEMAAGVLQRLSPGHAARVVAALEPATAVDLLAILPVATVANVLRRVSSEGSAGIIDAMPIDRREALRQQLTYPVDCAAGVMDPFVVAIPASATAGEARALLEAQADQVYFYLYVVNDDHRIAGVFDLAELARAGADEPVRAFMRTSIRWLAADAPLESVFAHPAWRDLDAMPVADADGRLLGVLRHRRMRQLFEERAPQDEGADGVRTVLALGELYWLGLCGVLQGFATTPPAGPGRPESSS